MGKTKTELVECLDKDTVYHNLDNGNFKVKSYTGRSEVWDSYKEVVDENGALVNYVACNRCNKLFSYFHHRSGTSTLNKHKSQCSNPKKPRKMKINTKKNIPKKIKILNNSFSVFLKDGQPLNPVEREEVKKYPQTGIGINAKYGKITVKNFLPVQSALPVKEIISKDMQSGNCTENQEAAPVAESIIHITENNNGVVLPPNINKIKKRFLFIQPQKKEIEQNNPYEHAFHLVKAANNAEREDEDQFAAFGENVAWTLRNLKNKKLVCLAKKRIYKILCEVEM